MRFVFVTLLIFSTFVFLTNPFNGVPGVDSSIFVYVARRMGEGAVPYLNVFDQKGPLIYVLDFVAYSLGNVNGLWILDCLALLLGIWISWRIQLFIGQSISTLAVLVVGYHFVACGGNMPEMWIIVFSGIAYMKALNIIEDEGVGRVGKSSDWRICGFCLAMVLLLKLNMIAITLPIFWAWMKANRKFSAAVSVCCGCLCGIFPFFIYFAVNGALGAWWEVYVAYNFHYASHGGWLPQISRAFLPTAGVWVMNIATAYFVWHDMQRRELVLLNLAYLTFAWGLVLMSGGSFRYYGPILPACVIPLTWMFCRISEYFRMYDFLVLIISLIATLGFSGMRNRCDIRIKAYADLKNAGALIDDKSSVTVMGCDCWVYEVLGMTCPGRFPFQSTIAQCSGRYRTEMIEELKAGKSKYLIVPDQSAETEGTHCLSWAIPVINRHYEMICKVASYSIWRVRR